MTGGFDLSVSLLTASLRRIITDVGAGNPPAISNFFGSYWTAGLRMTLGSMFDELPEYTVNPSGLTWLAKKLSALTPAAPGILEKVTVGLPGR